MDLQKGSGATPPREMKDFLNSRAWKKTEQEKHRWSLVVFGLEEKYVYAKKRLGEITTALLEKWIKI